MTIQPKYRDHFEKLHNDYAYVYGGEVYHPLPEVESRKSYFIQGYFFHWKSRHFLVFTCMQLWYLLTVAVSRRTDTLLLIIRPLLLLHGYSCVLDYHHERSWILENLSFNPALIEYTQAYYGDIFESPKETVSLHLRLGYPNPKTEPGYGEWLKRKLPSPKWYLKVMTFRILTAHWGPVPCGPGVTGPTQHSCVMTLGGTSTPPFTLSRSQSLYALRGPIYQWFRTSPDSLWGHN